MRIKPTFKFNPRAGQSFKFLFRFPEDFILVIDSREQTPLFLDHPPKGLVMVRDTLEVGDYSIRGFEGKIAVERKTIPDLLNCLGNDRERFKRELEKLQGYNWASIVVEGAESELYQYQDFSLMHPESVRQSMASIEIRHNVHFFYGRRADIERWVLDRLIKFWKVRREG